MLSPEVINYLVTQGKLTQSDLDKYQKLGEAEGKELEVVLAEKKIVNEEDVAKVQAQLHNLPYINLAEQKIDSAVLRLIPPETSKTYQVAAFAKEGQTLHAALVNPRNFKAIEVVEFLSKQAGYNVKYYVISPASFQIASKRYYALGEEVGTALGFAKEKYEEEAKEEEEITGEQLEKVVKTAPVSKIVSSIIKYAIDGGASDIHIEPSPEGTRVRFRIDGILRTSLMLPSYVHSAIVSRIKVLANLKLDETRKPQDGRVNITLAKQKVDLRVSILPLIDTEKAVLRVLDTSGTVLSLAQLGFNPKHVKIIEDSIRKSHGEFLVTGPTGSGKSTTLYAILNLLNKEDVNIITLEDPAEYFIAGINQSQVNADVGFSFANGLRAMLRQDPNIIMVGEVRDQETASLAVNAALTGHIVFSTLHTNDAMGAIPRLMDMGVEPFLLGATLESIIAQRLVRRICENCKQEVKLPGSTVAEVIAELKRLKQDDLPFPLNNGSKLKFYRGVGCNKCGGSGYKGRTVIAEALLLDEELKNVVADRFSFDAFGKLLGEKGYINMRQDGFIKALEGKTTIEEVLRVMKI